MSNTSVHWRCYGTVNNDNPMEVEQWKLMQTALCEVVRMLALPGWVDKGEGVLRIMHDGVSEP